MTRWASHLRLQYADGPGVRLDPVRLDVVAETETGDTRWLSEDVGAGKNWVGYHVVTLVGLHRFVRRSRATGAARADARPGHPGVLPT